MIRIVKLRRWLARRICRPYARDYLSYVDRCGLTGGPRRGRRKRRAMRQQFNHALARVGVIDYAERFVLRPEAGPRQSR